MEITHCPTINKPSDRSKINKHRRKKSRSKLYGWSCDVCQRKATCKELCPPMEWIVQQVEINPGREWIPDNPDYELESIKWPEGLSTSETIFSLFFFDHRTPQEISNQLSISTSYIYRAINQSKQIIMQNLRKKVESGS